MEGWEQANWSWLPSLLSFHFQRAMCLLLSILINILTLGAAGDNKTDNTLIINQAITTCAQRGGGTVVIPQGIFLTGTLHMQSNVTLRLEENAVLRGINDLKAYESLTTTHDLSKYESGRGSVNFNSASDPEWSKAMIQFLNVRNAGIEGSGTIDGLHVVNPKGEERMRGPHTILIVNGDRLRFTDFKITRSANYAILAYDIRKTKFNRLKINEGWDGIHIRGCENVAISHCEMHTGDDAIAGGYWNNIKITHCVLNSSCNGIRMIMPSTNMEVAHCHIYGPGQNKHITSGKTNSDAAISLEPGGWGPAPGHLDNIHIHHIRAQRVLTPLSMTLSEDNTAGTIKIDHITAHDVTRMALSLKSWGKSRTQKVSISHACLTFQGIDDPNLPKWFENRPTDEWPVFPCWGMYFRNIDEVKLKDIILSFNGKDYRKPMIFDNVEKTKLSNIKSKSISLP